MDLLTLLNIWRGSNGDGGSEPHPRTRERSFPVPSGRIAIEGKG